MHQSFLFFLSMLSGFLFERKEVSFFPIQSFMVDTG